MAIHSKRNIDRQIRTYPIHHCMTESKREIVNDFVLRYRRVCKLMINDIYGIYDQTGYFNKTMSYKLLPSINEIMKIMPKTRYIQMALD